MAKRAKPKRLTDEDRAALEAAAAKADKTFARRFSDEPTDRARAEPAAGESVAEVTVDRGGRAELQVLAAAGIRPLHVEAFARRADKAKEPWRPVDFVDGKVRFTPLVLWGAARGWSKEEHARLARCQILNSDLAAPWAFRLKVRDR